MSIRTRQNLWFNSRLVLRCDFKTTDMLSQTLCRAVSLKYLLSWYSSRSMKSMDFLSLSSISSSFFRVSWSTSLVWSVWNALNFIELHSMEVLTPNEYPIHASHIKDPSICKRLCSSSDPSDWIAQQSYLILRGAPRFSPSAISCD